MARTNKPARRRLSRWGALFCAALPFAEPRAQAADEFAPQLWLNPGILSRHFQRDRGFREDNLGFGAEVALRDDHSLLGGSIINSDRRRSRYGAYLWRPLHWHVAGLKLSAGVAVGAFDGYPRYHDGAWFIAPLPVLTLEGERFGANVAVIPSLGNRLNGALAVQFKMRVW